MTIKLAADREPRRLRPVLTRKAGGPQPRAAKSARAQQRRQEILQIATDTFAACGYSDASLAEIADLAGCPQLTSSVPEPYAAVDR